jgi:hypothetical protein
MMAAEVRIEIEHFTTVYSAVVTRMGIVYHSLSYTVKDESMLTTFYNNPAVGSQNIVKLVIIVLFFS